MKTLEQDLRESCEIVGSASRMDPTGSSATSHKQINPFTSQHQNNIVQYRADIHQDTSNATSSCSNVLTLPFSSQQNVRDSENDTTESQAGAQIRWPTIMADNQPIASSYISNNCSTTYYNNDVNAGPFQSSYSGNQSDYSYSNNIYNRQSWQANSTDISNQQHHHQSQQQQHYNYNYYLDNQQQHQQENVHDRYSYYNQTYSDPDYESQFAYQNSSMHHCALSTTDNSDTVRLRASTGSSAVDRVYYCSSSSLTESPSTQLDQTCWNQSTSNQGGITCNHLVTSTTRIAHPTNTTSTIEIIQHRAEQQNLTQLAQTSKEATATNLQHQQQRQVTKSKIGKSTIVSTSQVGTSQVQRTNQCSVCGRNYARPSTLKTHLRTHTNERPFKCNVCLKTFSQAANLTAHQRVHTGERPFSCPICGRQFSQSSSVITHLRTHSGERPYRCGMCSRTFSDSSTLTKHCRIHSGEKPYQCDYCPLNFSQSGNLSRHLKLHLLTNSSTSSSSLSSSSTSTSTSISSNHHQPFICQNSMKGQHNFLIENKSKNKSVEPIDSVN